MNVCEMHPRALRRRRSLYQTRVAAFNLYFTKSKAVRTSDSNKSTWQIGSFRLPHAHRVSLLPSVYWAAELLYRWSLGLMAILELPRPGDQSVSRFKNIPCINKLPYLIVLHSKTPCLSGALSSIGVDGLLTLSPELDDIPSVLEAFRPGQQSLRGDASPFATS